MAHRRPGSGSSPQSQAKLGTPVPRDGLNRPVRHDEKSTVNHINNTVKITSPTVFFTVKSSENSRHSWRFQIVPRGTICRSTVPPAKTALLPPQNLSSHPPVLTPLQNPPPATVRNLYRSRRYLTVPGSSPSPAGTIPQRSITLIDSTVLRKACAVTALTPSCASNHSTNALAASLPNPFR